MAAILDCMALDFLMVGSFAMFRSHFSITFSEKLSLRFATCGRQKNAPHTKDVHVLIPRICDYIMSHGKRELRL